MEIIIAFVFGVSIGSFLTLVLLEETVIKPMRKLLGEMFELQEETNEALRDSLNQIT